MLFAASVPRMEMIFENRQQAARLLAEKLKQLSIPSPIVLALPRGGVPIAYEVAKSLDAPLDVLVVRKIGAPGSPEFGIGAVTEDGTYWIKEKAAELVGASRDEILEIARREFLETKRRIAAYRRNRPHVRVAGRTAILIDDGLATGVTARVAAHYLKSRHAAEVILAVPVCAPHAARNLGGEIDRLICMQEPEDFYAVGQYYENFEQVSDDDVTALLEKGSELHEAA